MSKNGLIILKVDMKKAYDRMEWSFINRALKAWGFSEEIRRLIIRCVHSAVLSSCQSGHFQFSVPLSGFKTRGPLVPLTLYHVLRVLDKTYLP